MVEGWSGSAVGKGGSVGFEGGGWYQYVTCVILFLMEMALRKGFSGGWNRCGLMWCGWRMVIDGARYILRGCL